MRDIRFRAWDKEAERMIYSAQQYDLYYFEFDEGKLYCFYINENSYSDYIDDSPEPHNEKINNIMQFTGLLGKQGKEIYEGDILDFSVFDYNGRDTQHKGCVVYDGSRFMVWKKLDDEFYGSDGGFDLDWLLSQNNEAEVIGNIWENPGLIMVE